MTFDPTKPFGTISGYFEELPAAKFEQGGRFYDINRQELTSSKVVAPKPPAPPPQSLEDQIATITKKLDSARDKLKAKPTQGRRQTVTKLEAELATLVGTDD